MADDYGLNISQMGVLSLLLSFTNVLLEALLGAIPIIGDIFDATFKANLCNAKLLNEAMR